MSMTVNTNPTMVSWEALLNQVNEASNAGKVSETNRSVTFTTQLYDGVASVIVYIPDDLELPSAVTPRRVRVTSSLNSTPLSFPVTATVLVPADALNAGVPREATPGLSISHVTASSVSAGALDAQSVDNACMFSISLAETPLFYHIYGWVAVLFSPTLQFGHVLDKPHRVFVKYAPLFRDGCAPIPGKRHFCKDKQEEKHAQG